jgi:enoyl-[acyl-carrier protein] reductase II
MFSNRITKLFKINYPIIQAGMVWASGWKLAAAVSNAGGLGIIGSGSMYPDVLRHHLVKCRQATDKTFAVNLPLIYPDIDKHIEIIIQQQVPVVFTSAGNPATWTGILKEKGITVVHVVSSIKFARKSFEAGCDAVVAEGFEAGGHNGREETTTMVLVPQVRDQVDLPLIAAGGIATGRQMLAAMVLGAEGVQMGTRFVATEEASSHLNFKQAIINSKEGDTVLSMKKLVPVRLLKNSFSSRIQEAESQGADATALKNLLGHARAKRGMFEGDLEEGELEIGQVSSMIKKILPAGEVVKQVWDEFNYALINPLITP